MRGPSDSLSWGKIRLGDSMSHSSRWNIKQSISRLSNPPLSSSNDQVAVRLDSGSDSADRSWSTSHPGEGEASDSQGEQAKTINIDEPAPNSYVCLGYIFSIIAGLCFTSWQEEPINYWWSFYRILFSAISALSLLVSTSRWAPGRCCLCAAWARVSGCCLWSGGPGQ